jgi:hypothetical protein
MDDEIKKSYESCVRKLLIFVQNLACTRILSVPMQIVIWFEL